MINDHCERCEWLGAMLGGLLQVLDQHHHEINGRMAKYGQHHKAWPVLEARKQQMDAITKDIGAVVEQIKQETLEQRLEELEDECQH